MKIQKFPITAIIAVYYDNRALLAQFPRSVDLLAFLAGKKENEGFGENEQELYDNAFATAKEVLSKQYPWLAIDEKIQRYGKMPVLDYTDIDNLEILAKIKVRLAGNITFNEGDDLEVIMP
jgi:hypothetical protein